MKNWQKHSLRGLGLLILFLTVVWGISYVYWTIKGNRDLAQAQAELVKIGEPLDISATLQKPVPDEDNAVPAFLELFKTYELPESHSDDDAYQIALLKFIQEHPEFIQKLKQAIEKPFYFKSTFPGWPFKNEPPKWGFLQKCTEILKAEIDQDEKMGDYSSAFNTRISLLKLSTLERSQPLLLDYMLATAMESMAYDHILSVITSAKINSDQLKTIEGMIKNRSFIEEYRHVMHGERLIIDEVFTRVFQHEVLDSPIDNRLSLLIPTGLFKSDYGVSLKIHIGQIKSLETIKNQKNFDQIPPLKSTLKDIPAWAHFSRMLLRDLPRHLKDSFRRSVVPQRMVLIVSGLQRFHFDHQSYPKSLDELVPNYLSTIPSNPISETPIEYSTKGKDFKVVFPGGKDTEFFSTIESETSEMFK